MHPLLGSPGSSHHLRQRLAILIAALAAMIGAVLAATPVLAAPAHVAGSATSPSPSPTSSTSPQQKVPLGSHAKDVTFAIGPAVQVPSDHYFDGRPYISAISEAGGVVRDNVALVNVGRKPVTVLVYPADATQNGSTTFQLSLKNQMLKATGAWFSLEGKKRLVVTIPASHAGPHGSNVPGRVVVPFEARIPLGATPGDHAAALVAELDNTAHKPGSADVTLQQRLGVAVYIHLTGQLHSALRISDLKAHWNEPGDALGRSRYSVSFTVTNVGNVRLNVSTLLNTTRWFAGSITTYPAEISNLFPGSNVTVTATTRSLFGFGRWHLTASAFGSSADPTVLISTPPASETVGLWPIPWILIAIVVGVLLVAFYAQHRYRRWRKDRKENPRVKGGQRSAKGKQAKKDKQKGTRS